MRVLFTSAPMYGHLYPTVPLAWALRVTGHEVLVAVPEDFAPAAVATGLPVAVSSPPADVARMIGFDREGRPVPRPSDRAAILARSGRGWGRLSASVLPGLLALGRSWRPDLVLSEPVEHAGPLVAGALGVPWVKHGWGGLSVPEIFWHEGRRELAPERRDVGEPAAEALFLDACPPTLQRPGAPVGQPMRYVPYNGPAVLPPALLRPRPRPRVCVTLGTVVPDRLGAELLRELFDPLLDLDVEIALAGAPEIVDVLRPLPPAVTLAGWLPMSTLLPACDLVVHHGGSGTMLTALVNGLPQLLLPRPTADQLDNAERLTALGAGLRLLVEETSPARIRDAVERLLHEPGHRAAAGTLAAEIAGMPAPGELVAVLEKVAG
jgi:UDP:flavonoid glycosyltransferase YjiC (YdhE family)